jgi:hypothetical protein
VEEEWGEWQRLEPSGPEPPPGGKKKGRKVKARCL